MNAFRPTATSALRSGFLSQSVRGYATQTPTPASSSSRLPLYLGIAGVAGIGAYYASTQTSVAQAKSAISPGVLDKNNFKEFVLKEIKPYNHDSSTFIFELPDNATPGMRVASAVLFKGAGDGLKDKEGKEVIRPYTPTTAPEIPGQMDFLIKNYDAGNMSKHVHSLKVGDKIAIKGPIDKYEYKPNTLESIGMIAGGSGITPMWQVIQAIVNNPSDKTNVTLVYCNKSEKDILLREKFDELSAKDERFKVIYGLDKKPKGMQQEAFEGYVQPEHISKYMPAPGKADKVKVFVCGPPPQYEAICGGKGPKGSQGELKGLLADAGYQPDQVYKF